MGIQVEGSMIPRYIMHIDKRKLAVIINSSYLVDFPSLPIDKIEQWV